LFERLAESYSAYNKRNAKEGAAKLVELLDVQDDFVSEAGQTLFWGTKVQGVTILRTNNDPVEFFDGEEDIETI
jgi:hypothetical protein